MWRWGSSGPTLNVIVLRVSMTSYAGSQIMGRHVGLCQIVDDHVVGPLQLSSNQEVYQNWWTVNPSTGRPAWAPSRLEPGLCNIDLKLIDWLTDWHRVVEWTPRRWHLSTSAVQLQLLIFFFFLFQIKKIFTTQNN